MANTYTSILNELNREVARAKPTDPLQFCANWFNAKLEAERQAQVGAVTPATTARALPVDAVIPATFNLGRRTSVSAESMVPAAGETTAKTVIAKSEEQMDRMRKSIGNNLLFRNLEESQYRDVLLAMKEVAVEAGAAVIEQGATGDYFYVVETGTLDVYVKTEGDTGMGDKKVSYGPGSSFGELALLYAQPRAATVVSTSPCTLWALDRVTFRCILMETNSQRRAMYEQFLMDVPLFEGLSGSERAKISDSLELREFAAGEAVIVQGERGTEFYIIVEGQAQVRKRQGEREEVVGKLGRGDYFGELALLKNVGRAATVVAAGVLRVVCMSEGAFTRLLGPLGGILERHALSYGDSAEPGAPDYPITDIAPTDKYVPDSDARDPMDASARAGAGAWASANPFAASTTTTTSNVGFGNPFA